MYSPRATNCSSFLDRAHDEEQDLARMLAAAWSQVAARSSIGFVYTPLFVTTLEDPDSLTLQRLLDLVHPDLVADVVNQLHKAADGPLNALRTRTPPGDCTGGPTFEGVCLAADADLIVDGLLLDFKSTRHPDTLPKHTAWQLLGYLLLDTPDHYRSDTLGLYLTRLDLSSSCGSGTHSVNDLESGFTGVVAQPAIEAGHVPRISG